MILHVIFVAIGGFFGAIVRFSISNLFKKLYPTRFPLATFLINIIGSLLLGWIIGKGLPSMWQLLLGTGFMGAFTTFSTFKLESIQLHDRKNWRLCLLYLGLSYSLGILFAFLGIFIGSK